MTIIKKTEIGGTTGNYALDVYVKGGSANPFIFKGTVTTYTDTTHFAATDLIGYGNDAFNDWYVYVFYDSAGTGAAPQSESQPISEYVSSTGTFTHTAFTTPLTTNDVVLILHPYEATGGDATEAKQDIIIADTEKLYDVSLGTSPIDGSLSSFIATGGTALGARLPASTSIIDLFGDFTGPHDGIAQDDNVKASLDIANTELSEILNLTRTTGDIAVTAAETNLYIDDAPTKIIVGISIKIDTTDMATADTYDFKIYYRIESGGSYIQQADTLTYSDAQSGPLKILSLDPYRYGLKITAQKTAGTDRSFPIEVIREA